MQISWTILGSAAGIPSAERNSSAHVLTYGDHQIMFDCGGGAASSFLRAGFDPNLLDRVFISHMHPDHCSDLPLLIQKLYHTGRTRDFDVFLPDEAVITMGRYLDACYLFQEKFPFRASMQSVSEKNALPGSRNRVTALPNSHLDGNGPLISEYGYTNRMESFSYLVELGRKKIFYSGDLASIDEVKPYLDGLELLITETTHIDFKALKGMLKQGNVKKVILTHIADEDKKKVDRFAKSLSDVNGLFVAHDGLTVNL